MAQILIPQHEAILVIRPLVDALTKVNRKEKQRAFNALSKAVRTLNLTNGDVEFVGQVIDSAGEAHLLIQTKESSP